jgi:hypothetical protein
VSSRVVLTWICCESSGKLGELAVAPVVVAVVATPCIVAHCDPLVPTGWFAALPVLVYVILPRAL